MSITVHLDDARCRALLSLATLSALTKRFNNRKPRKGKTQVKVGGMVFSAEVHLNLVRPNYYWQNQGSAHVQAEINAFEDAGLSELIQVYNCTLTHDGIGVIPPSVISVDLRDSATEFLIEENKERCLELVNKELKDIRRALVHTKAREKRQAEHEKLKAERVEQEKLSRLADLRTLGRRGASALHNVALTLATLEGVSDEARTTLENSLKAVVDESDNWNRAIKEARDLLRSEMPPEPPWMGIRPGFGRW
jgi:hypothetical protein